MTKGKRFRKVKKSYKILIFILLIIIVASVIYIVNYFLDKEEVKEEPKTEETKDYSSMTVTELKEIAKEKGISVSGLKKAEIIETLNK